MRAVVSTVGSWFATNLARSLLSADCGTLKSLATWLAILLLALGHWQQMREAERVRQQMRVYEIVLINRGKEIDRVSTVTARQIDELRAAQEPVALSPLRLPDVQAGKEVFR